MTTNLGCFIIPDYSANMASATVSKRTTQNLRNIYLTLEGLQKARQELSFLKTTKRDEIAGTIALAVEMGNLEENAEYDAALSEQSMVENRIFELEQIVREAKIIKHDTNSSGFITIGSTVVLKMDKDVEEFTIVGSIEANPAKKMISNESLVGSALLGRRVGEEAQITTPRYSYKCKILEIR